MTGSRIIKCCHLLVVDDDDVSTKRQFLLSVHCVGKEEGKLDYYCSIPFSMSEYFLFEQDSGQFFTHWDIIVTFLQIKLLSPG